jgi:hypothetical protein
MKKDRVTSLSGPEISDRWSGVPFSEEHTEHNEIRRDWTTKSSLDLILFASNCRSISVGIVRSRST